MAQKIKVWDKIKEISNKVWEWIKGVVTKSDTFVSTYAPIAVEVLNKIKEFNGSTSMDITETIIEGLTAKYGNGAKLLIPKIRKWLNEYLPKVIDGLNLATAVSKQATVSEKALAAKAYIESITDKELKASQWTTIASMLANYLSDSKFTYSEIVSIIGYIYENNLNNDTASVAAGLANPNE